MAEVRMSIEEYNEMRDELITYQELLSELFDIEIDSWNLEWYKDHPESILGVYSKSIDELSKDKKDLLLSIIKSSITEEMKCLGDIEIETGNRLALFSIKHHTEESSEE